MPFDETYKGDPFRGDFPELPDREPEAFAANQASELTQLRRQPEVRHEYLERLRQRVADTRLQEQRVLEALRQEQPPAGDHQDGVVTEFSFLPAEDGFDTLHVPGEILIARDDYEPPADEVRRFPERYARDYLDSQGVTAAEVDCDELRGRVLRLIPAGEPSSEQLAELARDLRGRGFAASLTNIMPTAPVHKTKLGVLTASAAAATVEVLTESPAAPEDIVLKAGPAKVAIIDTGITDQTRTDRWLDGILRPAGSIDPLYASPADEQAGILDFEAGHGTFVAGLVQRVAPGADIRVYRAVASNGIASEVTVACQMIKAVKDGAEIVNLSLGCQTEDDAPPVAIQAALDVISDLEQDQGREVIIVAAAGNFGDERPCWPAAFRRVVSVAALGADWLPTDWSSRGPWVTCSTLGDDLYSTFVEGQESSRGDEVPAVFGRNPFAVWSGTSFAAPQVSGAIARLHQVDGFPLREALARLLASGRPVPGAGQAWKILPGI
jgi:hypothetical protein